MPELRSSARRMAKASIGQGLTTIWSALLGLITTPIILRNLGASQYGIFALIGVVSSYLSNLEFGFGHATVRFLARAHAEGDLEEQQAVFGSGLAIFVAGALVAFGLTFFGAAFIVRHFAHGPSSLHQTFIEAVQLGAPIIGISMLTSFASAALQALERYGTLILAPWIVGTALSVTAVTIVLAGGSLVDIIAAQLVINAALLFVYCVTLIRVSTIARRPRPSRRTFATMARYSLWLMLAGIAGQTVIQGPPAVLGAYKTTAEIAAFAVPSTIFQQLTGIVGATGLGFLPFVSAASADADLSPVRAIYAANLRMTILVLTPMVAFIAVFAHPLLATWLGTKFAARASDPLRFAVGAALVMGLSSAPGDLARGFARPRLVTAYAACSGVAVLAIAFATVPAHGATGAAFALLVGLLVTTVPFIFSTGLWVAEMEPVALLRSLTGPIVALAIAAGLYECGLQIADSFWSAVVTGAVATPVYLTLTGRVFLDARERRVLVSLVSRLRRPDASESG